MKSRPSFRPALEPVPFNSRLPMTALQQISRNDSPRIVPTTGIHNFRDFGGYAAAGGHLVRGQLYRSGEHAHATEADLELVSALGLAAVIDLRGTGERAHAPCRRPPGFNAKVIFADGETAANAPHNDVASQALDGADARRLFQERYATLPFRPLLVSVFRQYFLELANGAGPTVAYCSAGKDRTGVLSAVVHSSLGVHRDDIFEDYLLTNTAGDGTARVDALRKDLEKRFGRGLSDEAVQVVTSVEASFLDAAFRAITERCGSVDAYLADVLQVTPQLRESLSARFIV